MKEEEKQELKTKLEDATQEMLDSMKNNSLTHGETLEWYGYIRGTRDAAYSAGVYTEKMQENLLEALEIVKKLNIL